MLISFSGLTTIGATFAPTSVRAKIFNVHFQRTYATESNSVLKTGPGGIYRHILQHLLLIIKILHSYLTQQNEKDGVT